MNESNKDQYYFQGKYFDDSDQMFEYAKNWQNQNLDQETAERQLKALSKDIIMNVFLRGIKFKNNEFNAYLERIFQFAMNELNREQDT